MLQRRHPVTDLIVPFRPRRIVPLVPCLNVIAQRSAADREGLLHQLDLEAGERLGTLVLLVYPLADERCG